MIFQSQKLFHSRHCCKLYWTFCWSARMYLYLACLFNEWRSSSHFEQSWPAQQVQKR